MATLKDIAISLNLSTMAVSKAMRNAPDISKSTKDRVMREAQRLGYIPNQMARSLRGGTSQLLGVVVPTLCDPFVAAIVQGLEAEAAPHGYQVMVASTNDNMTQEEQAVTNMLGSKVEALFVYPLSRIQQRRVLLDAAANRGVPMIFLHRYPAAASLFKNIGWVVADAQGGAEMVTTHLIEKGHRDIIYLSSEPTSSFAAEHLVGFKRALAHADIPYNDKNIFMTGRDVDGGKSGTMQALSEGSKFTAVVCVRDEVAIGACEVLKSQGLKVPEDVSVVGFGDGLLAEHYAIPLTTVRRPQVDMGKAAFNMWQQSLKNKAALTGRYMPVDLVERASVAPVKQS